MSNKGMLVLAGAAAAGIYWITRSRANGTNGDRVLVTAAFASIREKLVRAWVLRGSTWYMYDPDDPTGSNLTWVETGEVISINVSSGCTLTYSDKSYSLAAGWNNIRW